MPKISIITPVHCDIPAKIDWLDEMIQSVLSQTITDWEMILIDDKSPLLFDEIKMKHINDGRLRWLENGQNEGPARTRNTAVALAESDCILPLDADDVLANNEVLEHMYDTWIMDKSKIIYGDLQLYQQKDAGFERGRTVQLGEYTFELAMNLGGIMPVTAMHSVKCHEEAGGWKHALNEGLEDVEYWIAAGKRGFCGQKIPHTTLVYRRQEESRAYKLKHVNQTFRAMQEKIKSMHSDIYRGQFPMACCGGKGKTNAPNIDPVAMSQQAQGQKARIITTLEDKGYEAKDLLWVAYRGPKKGRSGSILTRGPSHLPNEYPILGTGHVFQIHKSHKKLFSDRARLGFEVNQPDPRQSEPEPEFDPVRQPEPQVIEVAKPELSTLVRLDNIASETREPTVVTPAIEEVIIEPNPAPSISTFINPQMPTDYIKKEVKGSLHISSLDLSPMLTNTLDEAGYTVEKLAEGNVKELINLKNIGAKRAQIIIDKAKELISSR